MNPTASQWSAWRTYSAPPWTAQDLATARAASGTTISVVLPALNEEATIGPIVTAIIEDCMTHATLVDEVVVLDGHSTDRTAEIASAAGARVVSVSRALPELAVVPGKGEAMWRSLFCTTSDLIVFLDADLREFDASYVTALLGPLLTDSSIDLVKGYYRREVDSGGAGGGRVTELVARPLLNLHWPDLAGVVQPLGGEYAARRSALEQIPFATGYGVELGMLIDVLAVRGLDSIAQVALPQRRHTHQDLTALGRMAAELWQVALDRLDRDGHIVTVVEPNRTITQFPDDDPARVSRPEVHDIGVSQRPPAVSRPEYAERDSLRG